MDKRKLALVSLGHLSCDINGGALPACLPYLRAAHGLDYQATAGLMFAYSCLSSLIQPLLGWLADTHAKPWFIPLGVFLAGLGLCLMGFMSGYWAIFLCIAISGIGSAFFHPEAARYANRVSGSHKGVGMSFFSIGGNSGFIIGPLLAAAFVGGFGLAGMAVFGVIAAVMAITLLWQIVRLPAPVKTPRQQPEVAAVPAQPQAAEEQLATGVNDWRGFSRLIVVILCRSIVFVGCNTFIPLYWVNVLGQSKAQAAAALVLFGGAGVACNMLGGCLADRLGYARVIFIGFLVMAPAVLLFGLVPHVWLAWLFLPLLGLALYLPFSSQVVLGQKMLARSIGFASGVTLGLSTTIGGMTQPFLGWIADNWGLHTVFPTLAGVGALGLVFAFLVLREASNA